jgi:hypothetical protein
METVNTDQMPKNEPCPICLDTFTGSIRKEINCQYCNFGACLTCVKRYMLESVEDPHCMGCRRAWNRDFIDSHLTMAFRKGPLKKHREDVLLDREKARLPLLQPRVEAKVQATELNTNIANENKRIRELELEIAKARERVLRLYRRQHHLEDIASGRLPPDAVEGTGEKKEVRQFTQKCPVDDCRGFLSTAWKCGTCQVYTCSECLAVKGKDRDAPHTCNEDAKATAALIRKETKPCPKCGMGISKVDGCDQMWCVSCQTPFSWNTGRQVFGVVHNPHYYQWLRDQNGGVAPRVAGDMPCGGLVGFYNLQRAIPTEFRREVEAIHRVTAELLDGHLRTYPRLDEVPDNGDLGVEYTLKGIDAEKWKSELWKRETKREKGLDLRGPLDLFANVSSEVLRRMSLGVPRDEFLNLLGQLRELKKYVNGELEKIGKRYGNMTPKITDCWRWDFYGSNRGEEVDTRTTAERIIIWNPNLVEKLPAQDIMSIRHTLLPYTMPLDNSTEGYERYGLEAHSFNMNLAVRVRQTLSYLLSPKSPGYVKWKEPVAHTPPATLVQDPAVAAALHTATARLAPPPAVPARRPTEPLEHV